MRLTFSVVTTAVLATLTGCGGSSDTPGAPTISVLSSDPAYVTGGDALVSVSVPTGAQRSEIKLALNNADVTDKLVYDSASNSMKGVVSGMAVGANTLSTSVGGRAAGTLAVTNYPIGGPVFSGPQISPWICATVQAGLGAAQDAQCNAPTKTEYFYMSKASNTFVAYNPANPPAAADIATANTDTGGTVSYIVKLETGTMDRATYQIAVLADPSKPWTATSPQGAWNHKVYIPLQGGFTHSYTQSVVRSATPQEAMLNDMALKRGFLVAKTSFLQAATNLEWIRGAESLTMLKERIRKNYGSIRYTFSSGPSGGSMTQNHIANSYPGLLQGIIPMSEFTDLWGAATQETTDCIQVNNYFKKASSLWTRAADRIAVFGHADETTCNFFTNIFTPSLLPGQGYSAALSPEIPASIMYNATTNPKGARGTQQDYQVNYLGRRAQSQWTAAETSAGFGFARAVNDNVGVQYGLGALTSGKISVEQFVDLNEKIGGVDIDLNYQAARHAQDPAVGPLVYRMGFINDASQLNKVAIISVRRQDVDPIASHSLVHSFIFGDALKRGTGSTNNRALWLINNYESSLPEAMSFTQMDRWLSAIEADTSARPVEQKVVANKPSNITDGCWDPATTSMTLDNQVRNIDQCVAKWFPVAATPRIVAAQGSRIPGNISKCQLKPMVRTDYTVTFTDAQWSRLQTAFPSGVCDWSKPDASQTTSVPWLGFAGGPGGVQIINTMP